MLLLKFKQWLLSFILTEDEFRWLQYGREQQKISISTDQAFQRHRKMMIDHNRKNGYKK